MRKFIVISLVIFLSSSWIISNAQNIAITDDSGYTANSKAMLDVKATDKGMLVPRLTTIQRAAITTPPNGLLVYDSTLDHFFFYNGSGWVNIATALDTLWMANPNAVFLNDPLFALGVGTNNPVGKMEIKADASIGIDEPIFAVVNSTGDTLFAVYNEGVRINVDDNPAKATGSRGGFAVGGFSLTKGATNEYLRVTPDSVRIYVPEIATKATGSRGGFAVGGFSLTKGFTGDLLSVNNDSTTIYVNDSTAGLNVMNSQGGGASGFLDLTTRNYFIGHKAGMNNTTGDINTFFGYEAGMNNTVGSKNILIGYQSGNKTDQGFENIFIGNRAGFKNTTGDNNLFLGNQSGHENNNGMNNVFLGNQAGFNNLGFMGGDPSDGSYNTFIGFNSGMNNNTGHHNLFVGCEAGLENTGGSGEEGTFNVYLGYRSGYKSTVGAANTFVGHMSGSYNTTGEHNVYIGRWTGAGSPPGTPGANGSYNVFIGTEAGRFETGSYRLCINALNEPSYRAPLIYGEFDGAPNKRCVVIDGDASDNTNNRTFFVNGDAGGTSFWFNDSDRKLKKDISTIDNALDKVLRLRGVNYYWKDTERYSQRRQLGFIAQEVEKIIPEVVDVKNNHYQMSYANITAILVEAIKEQQKIIDQLKSDNKDLKAETDKIEGLQNQINLINQKLGNSASTSK